MLKSLSTERHSRTIGRQTSQIGDTPKGGCQSGRVDRMNGGSSSSSSSWLCPTELDRARVIDANDRVRTIRHIGAGAVGLALLAVAPWIGWWTLGLLALCALNFANVERRIRTSPAPSA